MQKRYHTTNVYFLKVIIDHQNAFQLFSVKRKKKRKKIIMVTFILPLLEEVGSGIRLIVF